MAFMKKYLLPILMLFLAYYYYSENEEFRPGKYQCVSFWRNRLENTGGGARVFLRTKKSS
jgi:hypothetical protein